MMLEVGTSSAFSNPFETREALAGLYYRGVTPRRKTADGSDPPLTEEQKQHRADVAADMAAQLREMRRAAMAAEPPADPPVE